MELVLLGYFPKKVSVPADFGARNVKDICSVSTCIAKGPPDGWVDLWYHNNYWLFPSRERAKQVLGGADRREYQIHAYRMLPRSFHQGDVSEVELAPSRTLHEPNHIDLKSLPPGFQSLGFDVVQFTEEYVNFGCSPLSCNGAWNEFAVNEHCLIDSLFPAIDVAVEISQGGWEPGPFSVVEVLSAIESPSVAEVPA